MFSKTSSLAIDEEKFGATQFEHILYNMRSDMLTIFSQKLIGGNISLLLVIIRIHNFFFFFVHS